MSDSETKNKSDTHDKVYGILAEFENAGSLIKGAEKVRDAGYTRWDCYSPFPVHGIDPAMGIKMTILPVIVFVMGLVGLASVLLLQWWANSYNWPWVISGKPIFSLPANIPIAFEGTVLFAAFTAFFAMWGLNKLPRPWHPLFGKDRFLRATNDGFFVAIEADDDVFDLELTDQFLRDAGATLVEACSYETGPSKRRLPRSVVAFILVSVSLSLIPLAMIAKARTSKSDKPHFHIFADMDFQFKSRPQQASDNFPDGRVSQAAVDGTVARGHLKADDHFYRGLSGGEWATSFPAGFEISDATMARGQERYGIFCAPCHGDSGHGNGMIAERAKAVGAMATGWNAPSSLHDDKLIRQPHGQLFNTVSHGIRTMPGYAAQLDEADRWAVILYMRALQRSQKASPPDSSK